MTRQSASGMLWSQCELASNCWCCSFPLPLISHPTPSPLLPPLVRLLTYLILFSYRTEKYVPRSEHDALRARVEALEAYIARLPPSVVAAMQPAPVASGSPSYNIATPTQASPPMHHPTPGQSVFSSFEAQPRRGSFVATPPPERQPLPPPFRASTPPLRFFTTMSPPPPGFPPHAFHSSEGQGGGNGTVGIAPSQTQHAAQDGGSGRGGRRASGASSYGGGGLTQRQHGGGGGGRGGRGRNASAGGEQRDAGGHPYGGGGHGSPQPQTQTRRDGGQPARQSIPRSLRETQTQPQPQTQRVFSPSPTERRASFPPSGGQQHWRNGGFGAFPAASGTFGSSASAPTGGTASFHTRTASSGSSSSPQSSDPSGRGSSGKGSTGSSFSAGDSFHAHTVSSGSGSTPFPFPSSAASFSSSWPSSRTLPSSPSFSAFPGPHLSGRDLYTQPHPLHAGPGHQDADARAPAQAMHAVTRVALALTPRCVKDLGIPPCAARAVDLLALADSDTTDLVQHRGSGCGLRRLSKGARVAATGTRLRVRRRCPRRRAWVWAGARRVRVRVRRATRTRSYLTPRLRRLRPL